MVVFSQPITVSTALWGIDWPSTGQIINKIFSMVFIFHYLLVSQVRYHNCMSSHHAGSHKTEASIGSTAAKDSCCVDTSDKGEEDG